jgi:hypothetical protein
MSTPKYRTTRLGEHTYVSKAPALRVVSKTIAWLLVSIVSAWVAEGEKDRVLKLAFVLSETGRIYTCSSCDAHIASQDQVISKVRTDKALCGRMRYPDWMRMDEAMSRVNLTRQAVWIFFRHSTGAMGELT